MNIETFIVSYIIALTLGCVSYYFGYKAGSFDKENDWQNSNIVFKKDGQTTAIVQNHVSSKTKVTIVQKGLVDLIIKK